MRLRASFRGGINWSGTDQFKYDHLNSAYATELDIEGVKLWMHGHTHTDCSYEKQGCRIECNPKGYPNEKGGRFIGYKPKVIDYVLSN